MEPWLTPRGDEQLPEESVRPLSPAEREEAVRDLLPPAEFRELQRELQASAPFSWHSLLLTVPALAAMCAAMYLFFPHSRFAAPKETPIAIAEEKPLPDSDRKLLHRARELHSHGKIREALTLLAPAVRRVLESSDPVQAENAQALLAQFWEWRMPVAPVRVAAECRRILGCSPDHLVAKLTLARLQPQSFPALAGLQEKAPQLLRELSEERLALLRPLLGASAVTADQQSEIAWQYALAATGCWLAAGAAAFPDEPGFAEREAALALCRSRLDSRRFARLRCDILYRIWSAKWYFWNFQTVDGRRTHHRDLKREIDDLERRLEQ